MGKNAFENLLEALPEDEFEFKGPVREAMAKLAEKAPKLRDSVLAQADYSRFMDRAKDDVDLANSWKKWRDDNWLDDQKMTKAEAAKQQRIADLEAEVDRARQAALATGDEMTFEQLAQYTDKYIQDKKVVTSDKLDALFTDKEKSLMEYIKGNNQGMGQAVMEIPTILLKHEREFGEILDARQLVKAANEKGRLDLLDFYDKDFVVERRQKAIEDKHAADMKKVQEDADAKVKAAEEKAEKLKQQAMAQTGSGPVDMGGPELGVLQKQFVNSNSGEGEPKAPDAPLGESSIAAFAARQFLQKQADRGTH